MTFLARDRQVAASTQNQALNALVFFYKHVLKQPMDNTINAERAPRKVKVPVVLTREETSRLLDAMSGPHQLAVKLLYGCGLRISECVRLRVKDVDFEMKAVTVRSGKGNKDRVTTFPPSLREPLETHLKKVKVLHEKDLAGWPRCGLSAACAGAEISKRRHGLALAVCFSGLRPVGRSSFGSNSATSC